MCSLVVDWNSAKRKRLSSFTLIDVGFKTKVFFSVVLKPSMYMYVDIKDLLIATYEQYLHKYFFYVNRQ